MADVTAKATVGLLIFLVSCCQSAVFSGHAKTVQRIKQCLHVLQIIWNIIILAVAGATLTQV